MTKRGEEQVEHLMAQILRKYGPVEGNVIVRNASRRLEAQDGGTARDWLAALSAAILEMHPDALPPDKYQN